MPKPSNSPLRQNPFIAYRHPTTGEWLTLQNSTVPNSCEQNSRDLLASKRLNTKITPQCDRLSENASVETKVNERTTRENVANQPNTVKI